MTRPAHSRRAAFTLLSLMTLRCIPLAPIINGQAAQTSDPKDRLRAFLVAFVGRDDLARETSYVSREVDLNGDGKPETIVYLLGPWCGSGGCTLLVLGADGSSFRVIGKTPAIRRPIGVLSERVKGWRTLTGWVGGGGAITDEVAIPFDGEKYPITAFAPPARPLARGEANRVILLDEVPEVLLVPPLK